MKKTILKELFLGIIYLLLFLNSCQKWNEWDSSAGNQQLPPPKIDASYANVSNPTMASDGGMFYILSSNATIDGIDYKKGLMVRQSKDLATFEGMTDANAYVLSEVLSEWGYDRLKTLNSALKDEEILLGQPCLRKIDNEWLLFYSITAKSNDQTAVIGYAKSSSLDGPWEDQGELLSSKEGDDFIAYGPKFFTSSDNLSYYLVFGKGSSGIYITEIDKVTKKPIGTSKKVAGRKNGEYVENPVVVFYQGYYHLFFTYKTVEGVWCTAHVFSIDPLGDYIDLAGRSAIFTDQWAITRVLNDHQLLGGAVWNNITGVDILLDGDEGYIVHQAQSGSSNSSLQIRKLHWVPSDDRRNKSPEVPIPAISPEVYKGEVAQPDITKELIAGDWHFGTLWAHINSGINDGPKQFNADGTYSGGLWDYNEKTRVLHLESSEWGGEHLYLYLFADTDNIDGE